MDVVVCVCIGCVGCGCRFFVGIVWCGWWFCYCVCIVLCDWFVDVNYCCYFVGGYCVGVDGWCGCFGYWRVCWLVYCVVVCGWCVDGYVGGLVFCVVFGGVCFVVRICCICGCCGVWYDCLNFDLIGVLWKWYNCGFWGVV